MWDEREGFYFDLDQAEKRLKVRTIASFLAPHCGNPQ